MNSYKYADLIFMCSREQQAAPLPMDPNFANGQILERTVKQKFLVLLMKNYAWKFVYTHDIARETNFSHRLQK